MAAPPTVSATDLASQIEAGSLRAPGEFDFTILIALFGCLALAFLYLLSRRMQDVSHVLRMYVVTIIVVGALMVVSSTYATNQIAPIVGLFGTIAGYVLGRSDSPPRRRDKQDPGAEDGEGPGDGPR